MALSWSFCKELWGADFLGRKLTPLFLVLAFVFCRTLQWQFSPKGGGGFTTSADTLWHIAWKGGRETKN